MKKIYRATCRFDKKINDFRYALRDRVHSRIRRRTNDSEITRTIYQIMLDNKKLCDSIVEKMMAHLGDGHNKK